MTPFLAVNAVGYRTNAELPHTSSVGTPRSFPTTLRTPRETQSAQRSAVPDSDIGRVGSVLTRTGDVARLNARNRAQPVRGKGKAHLTVRCESTIRSSFSPACGRGRV